MLSRLISIGSIVLRKVRGRFEAMNQFGVLGVPRERYVIGNSVAAGLNFLAAICLMAFVIALAVFSSHESALSVAQRPEAMVLGIAGITMTRPKRKSGNEDEAPPSIRKMEADFKALAKELESAQIELAAGPVDQARGEEIEAKAQELEDLQAHLDRYNGIAKITKKARGVDDVTLPGDSGVTKTLWTTPGHLFISSDEFKQFKKTGIRSGFSGGVNIPSRLGRKTRLMGEQAVAFERKAFSADQLSDLGTDAIVAVDRDPELVRFEEPEILTIRDVLNVTSTTSDAVKYVKHTATTRAAQSQASRGEAKEYLKVTFAPTTVPVETIAVLSKVTEQDIADAPRLVGYINGEMNLDIKTVEEYQLVWGDGSDGSLIGLFDPTINMPEFDRAEAGDTVIDTIRRMRTDLRKKRVSPNFVLIDPLDWEEVELSKGSDLRYIWGLVTDQRGPRIWSLRVVESDAMTNLETEERRICVGDGIRGATIYDREGIQLAVGFVDDDFARNLRTLRAEERLAFGVKRPHAFEFAITSAPQS